MSHGQRSEPYTAPLAETDSKALHAAMIETYSFRSLPSNWKINSSSSQMEHRFVQHDRQRRERDWIIHDALLVPGPFAVGRPAVVLARIVAEYRKDHRMSVQNSYLKRCVRLFHLSRFTIRAIGMAPSDIAQHIERIGAASPIANRGILTSGTSRNLIDTPVAQIAQDR